MAEAELKALSETIQNRFGPHVLSLEIANDELTLEVDPEFLLEACLALKNEPSFKFEMLMDLCGVDYLEYGVSEWSTTQSTSEGFSRGVEVAFPEASKASETLENSEVSEVSTSKTLKTSWQKPRFAVVYHLLSLTHNHRLRLKTFPKADFAASIDGEHSQDSYIRVPSVIEIWNSANWYERETFDLFGILFDGHPDLRRILTDYGFIGHPFRKDFPLIGTVEMRYSAKNERVIYEPVSIEPRTLVPKVIRDDNRYL